MGVNVDEARSDDLPVRVDFLATAAVHRTNRGDQPILDRQITNEGRRFGAVDDGSTAYHHVECGSHVRPPGLASPCSKRSCFILGSWPDLRKIIHSSPA